MQISFGSDNHSGVHPEILSALSEANHGHAHSYGMDDFSLELHKVIQENFGKDSIVYPVFNGTAANVLCLGQLVNSYHSVLTAHNSHLNDSECGAPEKAIGCKVIPITSPDGKVRTEDLEEHMIRFGDQHFSQVKAISITLPTEYGCVYNLEELAEIKNFCEKHKLHLHIDGTRLIYAAHKLNCTFKDIFEVSGASAISFGGTKNGLLFGELCIFKNIDLAKDFKFLRKQLLHLPSKQRFISQQFLSFFKNDLWKSIAAKNHQLAKTLGQKLSEIQGVRITQPIDANAVFIEMPKEWIKSVRNKHFFYVWNEKTFEIRLLISFDHTEEHINSFCDAVLKAKQEFSNS